MESSPLSRCGLAAMATDASPRRIRAERNDSCWLRSHPDGQDRRAARDTPLSLARPRVRPLPTSHPAPTQPPAMVQDLDREQRFIMTVRARVAFARDIRRGQGSQPRPVHRAPAQHPDGATARAREAQVPARHAVFPGSAAADLRCRARRPSRGRARFRGECDWPAYFMPRPPVSARRRICRGGFAPSPAGTPPSRDDRSSAFRVLAIDLLRPLDRRNRSRVAPGQRLPLRARGRVLRRRLRKRIVPWHAAGSIERHGDPCRDRADVVGAALGDLVEAEFLRRCGLGMRIETKTSPAVSDVLPVTVEELAQWNAALAIADRRFELWRRTPAAKARSRRSETRWPGCRQASRDCGSGRREQSQPFV